MYKLNVINNKFKLFGKRETTTAYETLDELMKAINNVGKKSYYVTNEKGEVLDLNNIINSEDMEEVYMKTLEAEYNDIHMKIILKENKFSHEIKSKLIVEDKENLYMTALLDNKLFGKLELYDYFKGQLKELKDLDLAYMVLSLIFN